MGTRLESEVFNNALTSVEEANKDLVSIYEKAQKSVDKKLAVLRQKATKGLLSESQKLRQQRLNSFLDSIIKDLRILKQQEMEIIVDGFTANYANGYYGYGYNINSDLNKIIMAKTPYDYVVPYRTLNLSYVRKIYIENIASEVFGLGIKDRTAAEILRIQAQIKQATTQALVEGISPRELASRLKAVDDVFEQNLNHSFTVARTELLRGHSFGTEDAINTAKDAGVQGKPIWDATLDGFTRQTHRKMDAESRTGKQPRKDGLFHFPDGSAASGPRMPGLSAANSINCRCVKRFQLIGATPNSRGFRTADGSWEKTNGDLTYQEWAKTLPGKRSIEAADKYRRDRAKRLTDLRKAGKKRPVIEPITKRLK